MTESVTSVLYKVRDQVAYVTINRPEVLNAITPEVLEGLSAGIHHAVADESTRAVVFRGAGSRAFCAGVDLKYFQQADVMADAAKNLAFTASIRDVLLTIQNSSIPTIAAVEGYALAGGLELALACDFIVCTDDSRLGDQHANFNLMAGAGATQRLPRRVGTQRALELLMTGRHIDGVEAVRIGLALASVPPGTLDAGIEQLAAGLRGKSRPALMLVKRAVQRGAELPLRDALDFERLTTQEYFSIHSDALEGLASFNGS